MSNITDFISQYGELANQAASDTGLSQSQVLGQWGLETGWGTSMAGVNNPGNVSPGGTVANYSTPQAGLAAYESALAYEGVPTADLGSNNQAFVNALQIGGYAPGGSYGTSLMGTIQSAQNALSQTSQSSSTPQSVTDLMSTNGGKLQNADGTTPKPSDIGLPNLNIVQWLNEHLGNFGLVFFGGVMIVGALLISQKNTVITLAKAAVK